ncbi:MAG: glycosyltransferase [Gammaproteobacteria bacterium]
MKILFLSQRFLYPMDTGGKIRTGKTLEQLARKHDITVVGNFEAAKDAPHEARMRAACARYVPVPWVEPRRGSPAFFLRLARNCFSRYPVTALNDYSPALETAVLDTLAADSFDLAICDFVQSALLFRQVRDIPRLLFQHNVEARIFERHVKNARNPVSRKFWDIQYRRMLAFESAQVRDFDAVVAVSEPDAEVFRQEFGAEGVHAIPTGVDLDFYAAAGRAAPTSTEIVFCGSMDWLPNEDGIRFFLESIAPQLDGLCPDWHLTVVGRNPSEWLRNAAADSGRVTLTGWVDDVRPYLERAAACIVPLRIGGGTRMKIYEAMAMSKAVVSTRVGAEGLDVTDGADIRLVDEPRAFAEATAELLRDAAARDAMGDAARRLVEEHFGWSRVAEVFSDICATAVARGRSRLEGTGAAIGVAG